MRSDTFRGSPSIILPSGSRALIGFASKKFTFFATFYEVSQVPTAVQKSPTGGEDTRGHPKHHQDRGKSFDGS